MKIKNIICFDIGGTFIKYGVITENGDILYKDKTPTPKSLCRVNIPKKLCEIINDLKEQYNIEYAGISTAGQVDIQKGEVVAGAINFADYSGAKLAEEILKETGGKAFAENDVNAAALGEMWVGAARNLDTFVCLTLGTGIGGAIVINRSLYRGIGGYAGEVGHMTINFNGEKCNCGFQGCFENYASTSALVKKYNKAVKVEDSLANGEEVMQKVQDGNTIACNIYKEYLNNLVVGLVNLTHILDPGTIIIGGGIAAQGDKFFNQVNSLFKKKVMEPYRGHTKIIKAGLNNDAGLLGACYIVKDRLSH